MALFAGTRVGPYEIVAPLGAGGMGEVYRARDTKLNREIAIKVLPAAFASDAARVARFRKEAQLLASLNHPNIAAIHGIEETDGILALALELVDGEDLAQRLARGPVPPDEVCAIGRQIAEGLEAAHEKGIVHRDLKPANVKLTRNGQVKILDFGLAKAYAGDTASAEDALSDSPTKSHSMTQEGIILGTAPYMSPEQARGGTIDKRSDIWSFGVVLFEMLTGRRLFRGDTVTDVLAAVLRQDLKFESLPPMTPASLHRVLQRSLERDPKNRLRDIGEARVALSDPHSSGIAVPPQPSRKRSLLAALLVAAALALVAAAIAWKGFPATGSQPSFQRITFRRGTVNRARFLADGSTIVYSAQWEGKPAEVFSVREASQESRSLNLTNAILLAVSPTDELALKLRPAFWRGQFTGTIATVPFSGGSPRELLDQVLDADWSPDGSTLAILHQVADGWALEYPQGSSLTRQKQAVNYFRVSPDAARVVMAAGNRPWDPHPSISVLDRSGARTILAEARVTGLAWTHKGNEVWFTAHVSGDATDLIATNLSGKRRLVYSTAGTLSLHDISANGDILASMVHNQSSIVCRPPSGQHETDLAWLGATRVVGISGDGSMLLLNETEPDQQTGSFYVRKTDGSPAIRLGEGFAYALSSDAKWVVARPDLQKNEFVMVPVGTGVTRRIPLPSPPSQWWLFPDGKRILVSGFTSRGLPQIYTVDLDGKSYHEIAPEGADTFIGEMPISPDGKWIAAQPPASLELEIYPADGGASRKVPGFEEGDVVISWAADGKSLFVFKRNELPARIFRLDIATGHRTPWLELMPADPAGVTRIVSVSITPDGRAYAYNLSRELSDLYLIRGLK